MIEIKLKQSSGKSFNCNLNVSNNNYTKGVVEWQLQEG